MKNASKYIGDAIKSIFSQTFTDWEAIVVDDCSNDDGKSIAIVKEFQKQNSKITLVELKTGKGSSGARNEALKKASGKYYAFLDADDLWHPEYLETMYKHIQECTDTHSAIFYCGYRRMNEDCSKTVLPDYSEPGIKNFRKMLYHCPVFPSITIIDTQRLKYPVYFREELKSLRDDYVYLLDILKQGLVAVGYDDILADYRLNPTSMTASKRKMIKPQWRVYRNALKLSFIECLFYEFFWGLNGIKKYYFAKHR